MNTAPLKDEFSSYTQLSLQLNSSCIQTQKKEKTTIDSEESIYKSSSNKEEKRNKITFKPHQKFSIADDNVLRALVQKFGESNWITVADHMPGRNSRQCRERWLNYLSPKLNREKFTKEEDKLLLLKVSEIGTKWVTISKSFFPNRTDQMVKNRYYILRRKEEKQNKKNNQKCDEQSISDEKEDYPVPIKDEEIFNLYNNDFGCDNTDNFFDFSDEIYNEKLFNNDDLEVFLF